MERIAFYSKDELAHELGISSKTLYNRIQNHEDEVLKSLYREYRLFSSAERQYILEKLNHQILKLNTDGGGVIRKKAEYFHLFPFISLEIFGVYKSCGQLCNIFIDAWSLVHEMVNFDKSGCSGLK